MSVLNNILEQNKCILQQQNIIKLTQERILSKVEGIELNMKENDNNCLGPSTYLNMINVPKDVRTLI